MPETAYVGSRGRSSANCHWREVEEGLTVPLRSALRSTAYGGRPPWRDREPLFRRQWWEAQVNRARRHSGGGGLPQPADPGAAPSLHGRQAHSHFRAKAPPPSARRDAFDPIEPLRQCLAQSNRQDRGGGDGGGVAVREKAQGQSTWPGVKGGGQGTGPGGVNSAPTSPCIRERDPPRAH